MRFEGKVAIITGAGTGVGRDMAIQLAKEGADVVIAARRKHLLEETAQIVKKVTGKDVLIVPTDVTKEDQVENMVDQAIQSFHQIDFMINNAAIPGKDLFVVENTLENWNQIIATNLTSKFLCSRACLKYMLPRHRGVIINFSSEVVKWGMSRKAAYCCAKEGAIMFTQVLAKEVGAYGIRVNCVVPGATNTELLESYHKRTAAERGLRVEEIVGEMTKTADLQRLVEPHEVTQVTLFLCSDDASAITGEAIFVTAGGNMPSIHGPAKAADIEAALKRATASPVK